MNEEKARIHAHLCGDGFVVFRPDKEPPSAKLWRHHKENKNLYMIGYTNTEKTLLQQFRRDIGLCYGARMFSNKVGNEVRLKLLEPTIEMLSLGAGPSKTWRISDEIKEAPINIQREWLRAFFDDEGHICKDRISISSVNETGLKDVRKLLENFGINSKIYGPYKYKQFFAWHLRITKKENMKKFIEFIGFSHPKKASFVL